MSKRLL